MKPIEITKDEHNAATRILCDITGWKYIEKTGLMFPALPEEYLDDVRDYMQLCMACSLEGLPVEEVRAAIDTFGHATGSIFAPVHAAPQLEERLSRAGKKRGEVEGRLGFIRLHIVAVLGAAVEERGVACAWCPKGKYRNRTISLEVPRFVESDEDLRDVLSEKLKEIRQRIVVRHDLLRAAGKLKRGTRKGTITGWAREVESFYAADAGVARDSTERGHVQIVSAVRDYLWLLILPQYRTPMKKLHGTTRHLEGLDPVHL